MYCQQFSLSHLFVNNSNEKLFLHEAKHADWLPLTGNDKTLPFTNDMETNLVSLELHNRRGVVLVSYALYKRIQLK